MSLQLVFAYGLGRSGAAPWPAQVTAFPDTVYLSRPADDELDTVDDAARAILSSPALASVVVVAHSFAAIPAARALAADDGRIRAVVFIEPALHRLVRGAVAVERHIARVDAAYSRTDLALEDFWPELVEAITGTAFEGTIESETLRVAARYRRLGPPWRHELPTDFLGGRPSLVVTGGWNDEYEEIATGLERRGARHVILPGFAHRPQEHPDFNGVLSEFVETVADRL